MQGSGSVLRPASWGDAVLLRSQHPEASPICGGTDLMVDVNFGRARPGALLDLTAVAGIDSWELMDGGRTVRIGAGVCFARVIDELAGQCPALAQAARTVGSPQIRNRGTVAGNLATASPAGDSHPVLLACWGRVEAESVRGLRLIDIDDFFVGPKRSALEPDELIRAVRVPAATGPQQFAKVGPRNAMVIATTSFALNLDVAGRRAGTGIGSAGPTPLRARGAEQMLEEALADRWDGPRGVGESVAQEFGALVAEAASPIDDVRGSAAYRRHALAVLGRRCLSWALADLEAAGAA
ncbi:MAG: xanthine dehydrogenase family protein subunit M [Acidimicrobiaceae bacterium]|nr:xanthine dehydrogenase family protein subunit M [Acidimicrobiaceae bacterium]MYE77054.1 xanthine dehydrogenase family protein subunit M [Acidimicrobiaceae bacterium]MYE98350.1 xanthine dehydrogenase family protein subunit M [Acidimicrobiaceae bacterium]MYH43873.1 xanthine dehydrogenase family protein subunit M [Acidimicrobiaceae bacterium]MYI54598.1 xanthine dehydrogenase family protein subunit M [Acidimicrobiaceae bacterium]